MTSIKSLLKSVRVAVACSLGAATLTLATPAPVLAAGQTADIAQQKWSFTGMFGHFDRAQLQRGYKVYKDVCAVCHSMNRVYFRNLVQAGGPQFPEASVKALAATFQVLDGPNDQGAMFKRPARLSDAFPAPFKNDQEARAANGGALPPDMSVIVKARSAHKEVPFYLAPFKWVKEIALGYEEGGADYMYALLTGYGKPPAGMKLATGMQYNSVFAGHQIAMPPPLSKGLVKYTDGSPETVEQYSKDVTAFLAWAADPTLEHRKGLGLQVLIYLLILTIILYLAKRRVWSKIEH